MSKPLALRLSRLAGLGKLLAQSKRGIEKESLRITPGGQIAQSPHPAALGSALTHPYITTDYSEALLELRTPPLAALRDTLGFLGEVHTFVYHHLDNESIWAASMPCLLGGNDSIPIARYGSSNVGTMKHVYRVGLGYRYGRAMQAIAGVHYNYSLPEAFWPMFHEQEGGQNSLRDFISGAYFGLIRNFQRLGWLVPYLFGSSPAMCKSFGDLRARGFADFDEHTYFMPYATSLRMSDVGYKNKNQSGLDISCNSLDEYVATLARAVETPSPDYQRIGIKVDGAYRQLNSNILQIENEYYSFVRPKQIAKSGEKPTLALKRRGVQYLEIRALDVSPFDPLGVNESDLHFLEALVLLCLLEDSPPIDRTEGHAIEHNHSLAACCGRDPLLTLRQNGTERSLKDWAYAICERMLGVCELLDESDPQRPYATALERQRAAIGDPDRLPSARVLAEMRRRRESFFEFALRMSEEHERYFKARSLPEERLRFFAETAAKSLAKQREIEAADTLSFDDYLKQYFAQS